MMQALTDLERLELLHVPIEVKDAPDAVDLKGIVASTPSDQRDVRFEDVSFRYARSSASSLPRQRCESAEPADISER